MNDEVRLWLWFFSVWNFLDGAAFLDPESGIFDALFRAEHAGRTFFSRAKFETAAMMGGASLPGSRQTSYKNGLSIDQA